MTETEKINIPGSAIEINNLISTKACLAWFFMLYKAYPELNTKRKFAITVSELKRAIYYTAMNDQNLKKILSELNSINIGLRTGPEGKILEFNSLIAGIRYKPDINLIEYAYSPFLQEKLCDPDFYFKFNILLSRRFKSKHSLSIYCLALNNLYLKNNFGIKNFTLQEIRKYLGLEEYEYRFSAELYKHIIQKAEKEINNDSDLLIKINPIRAEKEKITGFQFEMSIKEDCINLYKPQKVREEAPEEPKPHKPEKRELITVKDQVLKQYFATHKISITTALVQQKFALICDSLGRDQLENYLLFLMDYTDHENKKGAVNKLSGFYINLLKDDTQINNYIFYLEQSKKKEEEKQLKIESLLDGKVKLKYEAFLSDDFKNYLTGQIDHLEDKFIEIIKNIPDDSMLRTLLARSNKGKIDKTLLTQSKTPTKMMILNHLEPYKTEFGYLPVSFEEWKAKTVNEAYLVELKKEIDKELV